MLRTTRLLICLKAGVMRYVGLASLLFLSLLAGYFYMDNRRLDARVVAEVASHQQTKANIRAGHQLPSGGGDLYWKPVLHMEQPDAL